MMIVVTETGEFAGERPSVVMLHALERFSPTSADHADVGCDVRLSSGEEFTVRESFDDILQQVQAVIAIDEAIDLEELDDDLEDDDDG